jgi:hypothetical protein
MLPMRSSNDRQSGRGLSIFFLPPPFPRQFDCARFNCDFLIDRRRRKGLFLRLSGGERLVQMSAGLL